MVYGEVSSRNIIAKLARTVDITCRGHVTMRGRPYVAPCGDRRHMQQHCDRRMTPFLSPQYIFSARRSCIDNHHRKSPFKTRSFPRDSCRHNWGTELKWKSSTFYHLIFQTPLQDSRGTGPVSERPAADPVATYNAASRSAPASRDRALSYYNHKDTCSKAEPPIQPPAATRGQRSSEQLVYWKVA